MLEIRLMSPRRYRVHLPGTSIASLLFVLKNFPNHYMVYNGRLLEEGDDRILYSGQVDIVGRLHGGKGGFGSMLRAIGAQIEKTTNREACRDLSGRRLRDINEEQRLKNWIAQQRERELDKEERHKKKLEKLALEPKHEFKDEHYEEERMGMTEKLHESVQQGFDAALKRPAEEMVDAPPKKKVKKFLMCSDEELSSSDESEGKTESSNGDLGMTDPKIKLEPIEPHSSC